MRRVGWLRHFWSHSELSLREYFPRPAVVAERLASHRAAGIAAFRYRSESLWNFDRPHERPATAPITPGCTSVLDQRVGSGTTEAWSRPAYMICWGCNSCVAANPR